MIKVISLKSFVKPHTAHTEHADTSLPPTMIGKPHTDKPFPPTLVRISFFNKRLCDRKAVSVFQAKLEAKEYFDKNREWNKQQVKTDPELLALEEMANFE